MQLAVETYQNCGLKGIAELYDLFPERLRQTVLTEQANLFKRLWAELSVTEQQELNAYSFNPHTVVEVDEVAHYQAKLADLERNHAARRQERIREVMQLDPGLAAELVAEFERAHTQLVRITTDLLAEALRREQLQRQRMMEATNFSLLNQAQTCGVNVKADQS